MARLSSRMGSSYTSVGEKAEHEHEHEHVNVHVDVDVDVDVDVVVDGAVDLSATVVVDVD